MEISVSRAASTIKTLWWFYLQKKIIVKVAAGLGNQMFMYANAYSLAKEIGYDLYVDNTSGYFQKKNTTHY